MDFQNFYRSFGLRDYPFNTFTTEDEKKAQELFVEPVDYSLIKDAFKNSRTIIMSGNRGTGKIAIVYDLIRNAPDNSLLCYIDDYSSINMQSSLPEFYDVIARNLVNYLFDSLVDRSKVISKLSRENKIFLSFLLNKFTTPITLEMMKEKIEKIQLNKVKRLINRASSFIGLVINYGLSTAVTLINSTISVHFHMLPKISEEKVQKIMPEIKFSADNKFVDSDTTFSFIIKVTRLIHNMGYTNIVVVLDKIDEDSRFANDSEIISGFISPLLTDNKILLNENLQIAISLWSIPFNNLKDEVRTQKYFCPKLRWTNNDLLRAFDRRIEIYSDDKNTGFNDFFDSDVTQIEKDLILKLANSNPRDLWHIFDCLFRMQFSLNNRNYKISRQAIEQGLFNYVDQFNYYEYYPKKKGSRSDSMDVYGYIYHLLKLDTSDFTANQLSASAGTGSSTQNYITGMQNIGLVNRTEAKRGAGIIYEVADPKVIYAIENKIKIARIC